MPEPNLCPRCGAQFECGMNTSAARCWCADLPPLQRSDLPPDAPRSCFCPACLKELLERDVPSAE